jgi:hypothetical protein
MRFATKFDGWLMCLLVPVAVLTCIVLPGMRLFRAGAHPAPLPLTLLPPVLCIFVLAATLPQYYEVRGEGLFIRQGWRKVLVPYPSLVELQPTLDARSAPVYSMDRLLVVTRENRRYVIAPAGQERFLAAVAQWAPHLERRAGGLSTALSAPTLS